MRALVRFLLQYKQNIIPLVDGEIGTERTVDDSEWAIEDLVSMETTVHKYKNVRQKHRICIRRLIYIREDKQLIRREKSRKEKNLEQTLRFKCDEEEEDA